MRICIVGGGNIGTALACYIKHCRPKEHVSILTRRSELFGNTIKCNDWENGYSFESKIDCISNNPAESSCLADIVFIALPHFAVENAFRDICPYVSSEAFIGVLPGGGGCEFFFERYFDDTHTLFGFQRVPFTAKLQIYGHEANLKSWKPFSTIGTQKPERVDRVCNLVEECGLRTQKATNYLSVALTPTNPILHTARIYEIFRDFRKDYIFEEKFKFYVGWTDKTSEIMLLMDRELQNLLNEITELDTSAIKPLAEHYEANTVHDMTKKINSIPSFQNVFAPLCRHEGRGGYIADLSSRMFTEDFPWGLALIRSYCEIFRTEAPMMDRVLEWYSQYMGYEWYIDGKFSGKDLSRAGVLSSYGIHTKEDLLKYYM